MVRFFAVLLVVALALPACNTSNMPTLSWGKKATPDQQPIEPVDSAGAPVTPPPTGLQLAPEQRFKDIPLPVGLTEDLERSFVYEAAKLQIGRMVYSSRSSIQDLANFFLRECPTAQWTLEKVLEGGTKTLLFNKSGKRLEVIVQEMGLAKGRRVIITLLPADGDVSVGQQW